MRLSKAFFILYLICINSFLLSNENVISKIKSWDGDIVLSVSGKYFIGDGQMVLPYGYEFDYENKYTAYSPNGIIFQWSYYNNYFVNNITERLKNNLMPPHLRFYAWDSRVFVKKIKFNDFNLYIYKNKIGYYRQFMYIAEIKNATAVINIFIEPKIKNGEKKSYNIAKEILNALCAKIYENNLGNAELGEVAPYNCPKNMQEAMAALDEMMDDIQKHRMKTKANYEEIAYPRGLHDPGVEVVADGWIWRLVKEWGLGLKSPISKEIGDYGIRNENDQAIFLLFCYNRHLNNKGLDFKSLSKAFLREVP